MADMDSRRRSLFPMSARKSAPVRSGGVNARRLALAQAMREEKKPPEVEEDEDEEEKARSNQCGNPFCETILTNRYARFCEDKAMCQCYRALKLQCLANAQAKEDEEDTRPLALVIKKKKKKEKGQERESFAIPRKKVEKRRLEVDVSEEKRSSSSSPRQKEKVVKKHKKKEEEKKKKEKRARDTVENGESSSAASGPPATSAAEFISQLDKMKKRVKDPRARQPPEMSNDLENGASWTKKRRLSRRVSADDAQSKSASSSPVRAPASDANWTIPRAKPVRAKTAAQAIRRSMNVELVPLGVANQANFTGGGRYVQNGNRSAAQSLRPSDPRTRPSMTKFVSSSVPMSSVAAAARAPFAPSLITPSRPTQTTQPTVPTPPLSQAQPSLPPLPPHAPSSAPSVPRSSEHVRAVTPSSSPVKAPVVAAQTKSSAAAAGVTRTRISPSDYLKNRKGDQERHPREQQPSRSSSLERSSNLTNDRSSGYPPTSSVMSYPPRPPDYHRSDSAPSSSEFRPRDTRMPIDPRRQYPEAEAQLRHQRLNDNAGIRVEYRDRPEGRGEPMGSDAYASGQRESRSFPPPRDRYPPRQQDSASFGTSNNGSYDYGADTHFSPESSPAEPYWREISREKPPPPQRAPSPRRNEVERVSIDQRKSDYPDPDEETPTFSYHEPFLPRLLSIFIRKLPQSLEAVFNVTKKPRKMNWYIKYVERIERLCQPCDLRVTFDGLKAVVTVHDREWLTLQGQSTLTLHKDVIKSLRAEAMTWLQFHEEAKNALAHYRSIYGSDANESYTFLRAWNELKTQGNNISLSRQANYFCGARLHHWNFVVGKVEIGSGSHEEKREAFRLATVSALDFLLSIGEGERRPGVNVKRERVSEGDRLSTRGGRRSSSRDSSANRVRLSPANDQADRASGEVSSSAGATSSGGPLSSAGQPTAIEPAPPTDPRSSTSEPQSSAEPSSSPVPVDRTETLAVAVIPTTDSNSSKEATEAADQSDPGEEMSISDASEAGSPRSTGVPPTTSPVSAGASAASTASASNATTLFTEEPSLGKAPSKPATTAVASALPSATAGDSATTKHTPPTPKAAAPPRRCMMCEMIRMRKPDGERCLRCQQKGAPVLGTS
ncbi:hypothetical protein PRNP1_014013 [Phytophthora ramorum]